MTDDPKPAPTAWVWCLVAGCLLTGVALGRQPFADRWDGWLIAAGAGGVLFCGLAFHLSGRRP